MKQYALLLSFIFSACGGCTIIKIVDRNDSVRIERHFGVAEINVAPDAGAITANVSSLGYVASPVGHTFGFTRQSITSADDGCRVIVWIDDAVDRDELKASLKSVESACYVEN